MSVTPKSQAMNLRKILQRSSKSSLFAQLDIKDLHKEKDFYFLYQEFKSRVPVFTHSDLMKSLNKVVSNPTANPVKLMGRKELLAPNVPEGFSFTGYRQQELLPMSKDEMVGFAQVEADFYQNVQKHDIISRKAKVFEIIENGFFDELLGFKVGPLNRFTAAARKGGYAKRFLPNQNTVAVHGKSRYQCLHAMVEALEECGDKVEALVCRQKTLVEMSFILAQRDRKFIPLKSLIPNLKLHVTRGEMSGLYRKEMTYFLQGVPNLYSMETYNMAPGVAAYQDDINIARWVKLEDATGVFYEFIPLDDIYPDGRFHNNYRRMLIDELEREQTYLLLASAPSGILAYNTGELVQVVSQNPLRVVRRGRMERLNRFGEALSVEMLDKLMGEVNEALGSYGFFIREFMVGDDVDAQRPLFVIEISRAVDDIDERTLQSVVNQIHTELELRNANYRRAFQNSMSYAPEFTFVPMGTFASLPDSFDQTYLDLSPDAHNVKAIIEKAWSKVTLQVASQSL